LVIFFYTPFPPGSLARATPEAHQSLAQPPPTRAPPLRLPPAVAATPVRQRQMAVRHTPAANLRARRWRLVACVWWWRPSIWRRCSKAQRGSWGGRRCLASRLDASCLHSDELRQPIYVGLIWAQRARCGLGRPSHPSAWRRIWSVASHLAPWCCPGVNLVLFFDTVIRSLFIR
jgi:hypothetical protein